MLRKLFMAMFVLMLPVIALGQISELGKPVKNVADADIVGSVTWYNDTVYVMNGFLYVENGEQLTIEPGTIIKGQPGSGAAATALIVARGGKIVANGTAVEPIIFTAVSDNLDDPNDIPSGAPGKGLWGSVIILGKARLNTAAGTAQIEGIPDTEPRGNYGGTDDNDNSGTFRYVSLRHGGSIIGAANEINGLTLGGVGRGTTIDHVEVYQNLDDGFEFFGGTVNTKYLANVFCDDDGFDTDFGFTGEGQYWFSIKDGGVQSGSRTFEWDACTSPATPAVPAILTRPIVSNVTGIGAGRTVTNNDFAIALRTGAGGFIYNSIFTEQGGKAIQSTTATTDALLGTDLKFINNVFNNFNAANTTTLSLVTSAAAAGFATHLDANNDMFANPGLRGVSRTVGSLALDPRPMGPTATGGQAVPGADDPQSWIDDVTYQGAFDPNATNWMCEWTASSFYSLLTPCTELAACDCISDSLNGALKPVKVFTDADMVGQVVLRADTVWNLNGFVYVENGEGLIIEPGTVIKGNPGSGAAATALIVARGGKIFAQGTPNCPIVMTAITDAVDDPNDLPLGAPGKGLWGSLLMLGKARLNTAAGTAQIEGIPDTEPRGNYGGTDDNDNSGILQYVSLRHGGSIIGAANEINGLTMGGVGRGTTIDHIEVYQNLDDGFEFFGGTVNTKYLVNAFCDDDGFDTDFGFRGEGQFWFSIKDASVQSGSRTFEWDACTSPATPATPAILTRPVVSNVTGIGSGIGVTNNDYAIALRTGSGGLIYNSIFTDMGGRAIQSTTATTDGLLGTDLKFIKNIFYGFPAAYTATDSLVVSAARPAFVTHLNTNDDMLLNPFIRGINRTQSGLLDPRPCPTGIGASGAVAVPAIEDSASWMAATTYRGAFDPTVTLANSWLGGWSFLSCGNHLGEVAAPGNCSVITSCCIGTTGNVNKSVVETPDLSDLALLVGYLTIPNPNKPVLPCIQEANVNASGAVDLSDLSLLVGYLTIPNPNKPVLPVCPL